MATPTPTQELARLDKMVRKGLPAVVLITGASEFFRRRALDRLLLAVSPEAALANVDGAGVRAADEGEGDGDEAADGADGAATAESCPELQDLRGGALFAASTVVVVRRAANWWGRFGAAVAELAPRIKAGSSLVVEAPKLDKRKKAVAELVKQVAAAGALFELRDLYETPYGRPESVLEGELCRWVVQTSEALGVALKPETAWLLVCEVGKDPGELFAELEKLRDQLGADRSRSPLSARDLAGRIDVRFESDPFQFAEAVLGRDRRAAYRSLTAMFARGVRQKDGRSMDAGGVFPFATSWLFRQLATLYDARVLVDCGVSAHDVAARVGVRQFQDRFEAQVRGNDLPRLRDGLLALHACQRAQRTTGEEPAVLLERFLAHWFDGAPMPPTEELEP